MKRALALLFPPGAGCLVCGDPRRADAAYCLCPDCRRSLLALRIGEGACIRCMRPLGPKGVCAFCRDEGLGALSAGYGAYRYAGAARKLVLALKFGYQDEAAAALGAAMAQCIAPEDFDALTPVPLHSARRRMRAANQARVLCQAVAQRTGLPVADTLVRVRPTLPQSRLQHKKDRQRNVAGAFAVTGEVSGRRLLLVDDVRTTGATGRACAQALLRAGAQSVSLLTAAIAEG